MDPLTALGLSANVAQFISYTFSLVSKSQEIYSSAQGCTSKVLTLEAVCAQLRDFSTSLELSSQRNPKLEAVQEESRFKNHVYAINDLSRLCKIDCDRLLEVVRKLQGGSGLKSRWQSFKLAFMTVWKSNEILDLEQRLHHVQQTLTLHICALTSYWHNSLQRQLETLQSMNKEMNSQQSTRLDDIANRIDNLKTSANVEAQARPFQPSDIISLQDQLSHLSIAKTDVTKEQAILRSLSFDSRPVRYSSIRDAHSRTFEWIFQFHCDQRKAPSTLGNMPEWLRTGDGFFWISGKPGSGKSTLIKFIADHPQTLQALSAWSYPKPTIIVKHFFWSAGTPMQKSWQGLLQTVLYEIFRQLPDLIESTCIERWPKRVEDISLEAWSLAALRGNLQRITNRDNLSVKFCFFIDGLDEFDGDHLEFCDALQELSRSPHIKLCVASRPWNVFEDSFGRNDFSKLYIHELTRNDIRSYVKSKLQEHPRWKELIVEKWETDWLINEITDRAAGVFLWVFLVTRQLRNGLTEYDSYSDMRRRLDNISTDLGTFFKQILDSVEPFYHEKMATTLRIALRARQPAPAAIFNFHDKEYEDEEYALKLPLGQMSPEHVAIMGVQIQRRLNGRCRGLLEVNQQRVEFLHRTVMDYLRTPEMSSYLNTKSPARFDTDRSLLRAFTAYIKTADFPEFVDRKGVAEYTGSKLISALKEALFHAGELHDSLTAYKLLDELACCIPQMHKMGQISLNVWGNSFNPIRLFFWEPVIEARLVHYLRYVLPILPRYFPVFEAAAESYLIFFMLIALKCHSEYHRQLDYLWDLLRVSSDPNETYCDPFVITVSQDAINLAWKEVLRKILPSSRSLSQEDFGTTSWNLSWALESGLLARMLWHGADPNLVTRPGSVPAWLEFVFSCFYQPPDLGFRARFLGTLDCFIAAGASMSNKASDSTSDSSQTPSRTGFKVFLDCLFSITNGDFRGMDLDLITGVAERLLAMAPPTKEDRQAYDTIFNNVFPVRPTYHSERLEASAPDRISSFPSTDSSVGKRRLADDTRCGMSGKKLRAAPKSAGSNHVSTIDHALHPDV